VEYEGGALGALGGVGVGVAELGRPGEVEEVVVEGGAGVEAGGGGARARRRFGRRLRSRFAGSKGEKNEQGESGFLLHGGKHSRELDEHARRLELLLESISGFSLYCFDVQTMRCGFEIFPVDSLAIAATGARFYG
jgi:hypothetical protein